MNDSEFKLWFKTHRASFPEIDSWMSKQPNRDEVLTSWRMAMRDVGFSDACSVSSEMGIGDIPGPRVFGDTARDVRRLAKERSRPVAKPSTGLRFHGEPRYRCLLCLDDGWVLCWGPEPMLHAKAHRGCGEGFRPYRCLVACSCSEGEKRLAQKWADEVRKAGVRPPQYDPAKWCRITRVSLTDQKAELVAWCDGVGLVADQTAENFEWKGRPRLELRGPEDEDPDVVDEQ